MLCLSRERIWRCAPIVMRARAPLRPVEGCMSVPLPVAAGGHDVAPIDGDVVVVDDVFPLRVIDERSGELCGPQHLGASATGAITGAGPAARVVREGHRARAALNVEP